MNYETARDDGLLVSMPLSSVNITLLLRNCFCDVFMIMISIITLETNLNNVLPSRLSSLARRNGGRHKKTKRKTAYMFVCGDGEQAFGPYGVTTLLTYMPPPPSFPLLREENSRQTRASALHAHVRSHFQYAYI